MFVRREVYHSLIHEGFCHGLSSQKEGRYSHSTMDTYKELMVIVDIVLVSYVCVCGGVSSLVVTNDNTQTIIFLPAVNNLPAQLAS